MNMPTEVWEIMVPTEMDRNGVIRPISTRYHRIWDEKVRAISKGLTILVPAKGQWVSPSGVLYSERMIPVRIACGREQIESIINLTMEYYNQEAVFAYKISNEVILAHRNK